MGHFNKIHHVAIICSDYTKSKDFYTKILGFKIIQELYRQERKSYKLDLSVQDGVQIELFSFTNPLSRVSRPEACGLRHLAFGVTNINTVVSYLKSHNIEVEEIRLDELTNRQFTFFMDPDGLPLEIYEDLCQ